MPFSVVESLTLVGEVLGDGCCQGGFSMIDVAYLIIIKY